MDYKTHEKIWKTIDIYWYAAFLSSFNVCIYRNIFFLCGYLDIRDFEIFYFKLMAYTISFYDGDYSSKLIKFLKFLSSYDALIIAKVVFIHFRPILRPKKWICQLISIKHRDQIIIGKLRFACTFENNFSGTSFHRRTPITKQT